MWFDPILMFRPGLEMGKFMNGSDQEGIRVEVMVDRDPVTLSFKWMTVIPKPTAAALRYPKLAVGPHNPLCNKIGGLFR